MKKAPAPVVALALLTSEAYAATGPEAGKGGMLLWIFLAFIGAVIVLQFIPGIALFIGMLKELLFSAEDKKTETKKP